MRYRMAIVAAYFAVGAWVTSAPAQMTFGLKGGLVSSTLKVPDTSSAKPFLKRRSAYGGGAFLTLGGGAIALQLEALYAQKGVKLDASSSSTPITGEYRSAYLEVPVLIRLSLPTGNIRPYVYGGGAAAFEMKCEGTITAQGQTTADTCDSQAAQSANGGAQRRKLDWTALGGGGVQVGMGGVAILGEVRYALGLQSLDKSSSPQSVKNQALSFLAGVAIPLGHR